MQSDGHGWSKYEDFFKDMKFILDSYISDLKDWQAKNVTKMFISIIQDPDCKELRPKESTTESSDERFSNAVQKTQMKTSSWQHFLDDMLTSEVGTRVTNCLDYMEQ